MVNYWIFKVKDEAGGLYGRNGIEIFNHRINEKFWGIREFNEKGKRDNKVDSLEEGDYAIFYLIGKNANSFIGNCILDSGYQTLDAGLSKNLVHKEYIDYNKGVFLKEAYKWVKHLPIDSLRSLESFNISGLGAYFQGNIKKLKNCYEYQAIINLHKKTDKNRINKKQK